MIPLGGLAIAIVIAVIAVIVLKFFNFSNGPMTNSKSGSGWQLDREFELQSGNVTCDLHVFESVEELVNQQGLLDSHKGKPFIVRGLVSQWPAKRKWKFDNFTSIYGNKLVKTGSESSIVFGGGDAVLVKTVNQMLQDMRTTNKSDFFTFDVSILKSIPALRHDYTIPRLFAWDTAANEEQSLSWHMLSLGGSRTGLPFHVHGATWLGLVYGQKRWFLYPPGYNAPESVLQSFNPSRPVVDWLAEVYPLLAHYPKPPAVFVSTESIESADNKNNKIDSESSDNKEPVAGKLMISQSVSLFEGSINFYILQGIVHLSVSNTKTMCFTCQPVGAIKPLTSERPLLWVVKRH